MFRVVAALIVLRLFFQAGGMELCCAEQADSCCPGEHAAGDRQCQAGPAERGEDCSPACDDCTCCGHRRLSQPLAATPTVPPPLVKSVWVQPLAIPMAPELDQLLRVPKRAASV